MIFAPYAADTVGVFAYANRLFSAVDISGAESAGLKYDGAATASNGLVVFAPADANSVGVFDPITDVFEAVDISNDLSVGGKFAGAVALSSGVSPTKSNRP